MESQRQIRFGELIRSLISDCLLKEDFYDQDISPTSITVSFVRMSKDLKIANIYFMPLGGKNKIEILQNLNKKKTYASMYYLLSVRSVQPDTSSTATRGTSTTRRRSSKKRSSSDRTSSLDCEFRI